MKAKSKKTGKTYKMVPAKKTSPKGKMKKYC